MDKLKRYIIFLIGLFINSFGVSLITKADLGTSPISSIPYVLSLNFPLTLGQFTIIFSLLLIAIQLVILRRNFKAEHLLQIPISVIFGYFIDFTMFLLGDLHPETYILKFVYLLIGCVILGFGVYTEVLANVAMLPGESFVRAVSSTWKTEFGTTKVSFDVSLTVIAAVLSFVFAGKLDGVREGTVIAALLVGFIARLFGRKLSFLETILFARKQNDTKEKEENDDSLEGVPSVIVIGRQFGSGGHDIGKRLAERLGWNFYDNEIIQLAAGSTGYSPQFIKNREESMTNSLLYDLVSQVYIYSAEYEAPKDQIFESEASVIRDLADKGNCIIVGRCADYILKDRPGCLRVFLHASMDYRISRIMKTENLDSKEAEQKIRQNDKRRADNYHYYTRQVWGHAKNYDITLCTELPETVIQDLILSALNARRAQA